MAQLTRLLIITETPGSIPLIGDSSLKENFEIQLISPRENILAWLKDNEVHIAAIHCDLAKSRKTALDLLKKIKKFDALIDVLILGTPLPEGEVVEFIGKGATSCCEESVSADAFKNSLLEVLRRRTLRKDTLRLERQLEKKYSFQGIIGKSPYMLETYSLIQKISKYFTTVLITGETGTGKELVARAVHALSETKNRSFIVCDCVSIPENLFESELFGYTKGAFTGADRDKKGLFEAAHQGNIFLDEIGEIPLSIQAKLLRVLEHHQFRPLGSNEIRSVDVRVIAATSKDLREQVEKGEFREDLFHRLNKVEIHLPPLRLKPEDIPPLTRHFLHRASKELSKELRGVSRQVQKLFQRYHWPGNVRELENVLESASILTKKDFIDIPDLPKYLQKFHRSLDKIPFIERKKLSTLKDLEKDYVLHVLEQTDNNLRKAAKILDISRTTLYSKLKKYRIGH
jgi:DNA-binding NtrC family response regulator